MLGRAAAHSFVAIYAEFYSALQDGDLDWCKAGTADTPALSLEFWRSLYHSGQYAAVADAAVRAYSIPLTNATSERSFSVLRNREATNRLLAEADYVTNMVLLGANRPHIDVINAERAPDLIFRLTGQHTKLKSD